MCRYLYDNRAHGLAQLLRGCRGRSIYWQRGGSRPQPRTWQQQRAVSIVHIRVPEAQHRHPGGSVLTTNGYPNQIFKLHCYVYFNKCTTYTKSSWSHHPQWSKVPFFTSHWFKILVTLFKILKNTECSPMVRTAPTFRAERSPEQPRSCGATELASGELEIVNWKGECRKGQGAGGGVVLAGSIHAVASGHMEPPPTPDTRHS